MTERSKCCMCNREADGKCNNCYDLYCEGCFNAHLHDYMQLDRFDDNDNEINES